MSGVQNIGQSQRRAGPAIPNAAGALSPESVVIELLEVFHHTQDAEQFGSQLTRYLLNLTGATLNFLFEVGEDNEPVVKHAAQAQGIKVDARAGMEHFTRSARVALRQGRPQQVRWTTDDGEFAVLCAPFATTPDEPHRCLVLVLPPERKLFAPPTLTILQISTQFFLQRKLILQLDDSRQGFRRSTALVELFSRASGGDDLPTALINLANELKEFIGCDYLVIATTKGSHKCKIEAVSGMSDTDPRSMSGTALASGMRESVSLESTLVWPRQGNLPDDVLIASSQRELTKAMGASRCVISPLVNGHGKAVGSWALLWEKDDPVERRDLNLVEACRPHLGSLVGLLRESKPGKFRGSLRSGWRKAGLIKKTILLSIPILLIAALFIPAPYRVTSDCRLQPVKRRTVAAPFDNVLEQTYVKPGQEVAEGQILAKLDGKEVRWQLSEAKAKLGAAIKKRDDAMVRGVTSDVQMATLELEGLKLEVERLTFQKDNLEIVAPIDGIVLTGNLERSEGVPVRTGQKLFEIAPLESMLVEISVPDSEIRHIAVGMPVELRLESQTAYLQVSKVERIYPISTQIDGANVFICEGTVKNGYDLQLIPDARQLGDFPTEGKSLVAIGQLGGKLHFRIFDADGTMVVDKGEEAIPIPIPEVEVESEVESEVETTTATGVDEAPDDRAAILQKLRELLDEVLENVSGYELWISDSQSLDDFPAQGKSLVAIGRLGGKLHFRVFNGDGRMVADEGEDKISPDLDKTLRKLSALLGDPLPAEISAAQKREIIETAALLVDHNLISSRDENTLIEMAGFLVDYNVGDAPFRPGMRGRAKVITEYKPVGWILFHRLWDFFRLRFW